MSCGKRHGELRHARSTSQKTLQRAYLHVSPLGIDVTPQGAVIGRVAIHNSGHLPARRVSSNARIVWSDDRSLDIFDEPEVTIQHSNVLAVADEMPRGTGTLNDGRRVLNAGRGFIYVWGKVTYQDGFGEARWLTFCHRYNCASPKLESGGIDPKFSRHHHFYNDGN